MSWGFEFDRLRMLIDLLNINCKLLEFSSIMHRAEEERCDGSRAF